MKKFNMPEIETIVFAVEDIITASGDNIDQTTGDVVTEKDVF